MALHQTGALLLILLTACASTVRPVPRGPPPRETADTRWYEVVEVEPGGVATRPVEVGREEFQRAMRRLAREARWDVAPQEAARACWRRGWRRSGWRRCTGGGCSRWCRSRTRGR